MPAAVLVRYLLAVTSADAAGLALIASMTCVAVLVIAPAAPVARLTVIALPATLTLSGALFAAGSLSWAVMALPPSWPHAFEVRTIARSALAVERAAVLPTGRLVASKVT